MCVWLLVGAIAGGTRKERPIGRAITHIEWPWGRFIYKDDEALRCDEVDLNRVATDL